MLLVSESSRSTVALRIDSATGFTSWTTGLTSGTTGLTSGTTDVAFSAVGLASSETEPMLPLVAVLLIIDSLTTFLSSFPPLFSTVSKSLSDSENVSSTFAENAISFSSKAVLLNIGFAGAGTVSCFPPNSCFASLSILTLFFVVFSVFISSFLLGRGLLSRYSVLEDFKFSDFLLLDGSLKKRKQKQL